MIERGYEGRLLADERRCWFWRLSGSVEALDCLVEAIERAKLRPGSDVTIAPDVASTQFWDGKAYRLTRNLTDDLSSLAMIDLLESLLNRYAITSIEDGLAEEDWSGWQEAHEAIGYAGAVGGKTIC